MHIVSIPRHQIETGLGDYADILRDLLFPADRAGAIESFEKSFARYLGCRHALAVASGRLAMHLVLESLDAAPGDEAIVPAFNLFSIIERFCQLGVVPRFCDIRKQDLTIDVDDVERKISPKTRFILATHMFGYPAQLGRLRQVAAKKGLILLEDCAHALGTEFEGRKVGTFGRASIFSFSVLKLITTFGGGMIATNDDALAFRIRTRLTKGGHASRGGFKKAAKGAIMDLATREPVFSLAAWPVLRALRLLMPQFQKKVMTEIPHMDRAFDPDSIGHLHTFQARLGQSQLAQIEDFIARRSEVNSRLDDELRGIPQITPLEATGGSRPNGLYYGVLAKRASELAEYLFRRGIDCETREYRNCADLEMYRDYACDCLVAREVESKILRLPNYPSLTSGKVRRIAHAIRKFYA